eukprot:GHVT01099813.1.p3 GENE.GHVT01099813.1~~GHVT01099813.1.p3  ORF type:complete len:101 (+),score=9.04 GHVT01099813.1:815-1117(+)
MHFAISERSVRRYFRVCVFDIISARVCGFPHVCMYFASRAWRGGPAEAARFSFPHRFHYEAYFGPPQTEEEKGHTTCRVSFNVKQLKLPHTLDSAILRPC